MNVKEEDVEDRVKWRPVMHRDDSQKEKKTAHEKVKILDRNL